MTLQLHTAHILSAQAQLEQKAKAAQEYQEQKKKYFSLIWKTVHGINYPSRLDADRLQLLEQLRQVSFGVKELEC